MNKQLSFLAAVVIACVAMSGCQTRITAEKYPEQILPIQKVVQVNGQDQVITEKYQIASGGWYATARSPLYAAEALEGLNIGVHTNGSVTMEISRYSRDTSTNSVIMVEKMFSGGAQLAIAIGDAYTKIAGGGAQASTATDVAQKVISSFKSAGGDESKATVTTDESAKTIKVSDGKTCTTCTQEGKCTSGSCTQ